MRIGVEMDRLVLDLGIKRADSPFFIRSWNWMYVGDCSGDAELKFDNGCWLDPTEFEKVTGCENFNYLHISNESQPGEEISIYYEEKKTTWVSRITQLMTSLQ